MFVSFGVRRVILEKIDIKSLTIQELEEILIQWNQPKFRAKQIFDWLHKKRVLSFSEMTNLPEKLREILQSECQITVLNMQNKLVSKIDGTVKYLYQLSDKECVESVLMKYRHGNSICISTQVGCKMGCAFCASTKAGFVRNLTTSEILQQIYQTEQDLSLRISHVVLMGIGEPLDNYHNVVTFLQLIHSPFGANISLRNISLSTCGVVDKINQLAELKLGITLSVSLHASSDQVRSQLMPINQKWNIEQLLKACKYYTNMTGRRISFEYALIQGENDSIKAANQLADLLKGQLCHVNLIPVNEVHETTFQKTNRNHIYQFQKALEQRGINATIRRTLGADINAACGQLRRDSIYSNSK